MKATREVQLERGRSAEITAKLDKIADLLELLVQMQGEDYYPLESEMKKSFIRRAEKLLGQLKAGKLKMHTYGSFADFDSSTG